MASMKITGKLSKFLTSPTSGRSCRIFATSATRPLQAAGREKETLEKTAEAASAVKDGSREVRATVEQLTNIGVNTSDAVAKLGKDAKQKVKSTKDAVTGKGKNKVSGVLGVAKDASESLKGKVNK